MYAVPAMLHYSSLLPRKVVARRDEDAPSSTKTRDQQKKQYRMATSFNERSLSDRNDCGMNVSSLLSCTYMDSD